ncbi:tRNA lysidine(34) synthetase TilS [Roseimaritima ulvae]|uniref:tRNA(Ile)-lysidine synthase n=1 Tax=Roseimaritima ulvae TaxID=980254 RepID=A0A5B9QYL1_9BACT|nr:tRNA lysidine(34) synthetase TilS [Roseimaritima ulvae]QEG39033.1 tRNA(Ile)-lysidine synthase [Roseimaritima ulvae]
MAIRQSYQLSKRAETMGTEKPSEDPFICLCQQVAHNWPPRRWADVSTVVAVSGGADSVALLRTLAALHQQAEGRGRLHVVHFHHRMRGPAADADAEFVRQLAADLQLEFQLGYAAEQVADEAAMRDMRYQFLGEQAHRLGARYVALGHTLDDNVETLLHQTMRGCGPAGWTGMPVHRELVADVVLMRPLLSLRRQGLTAALRQLQQPWREDATNQQLHWKRNWIRHQLLPLIESQYPQASERMARTIEQQAEVMEVIDEQARCWIEACVTTASGAIVVRHHAAANAVVIHALRKLWDQQAWPRGQMSESHWRAALAAIKANHADRFDLPGGVAVMVNKEETVFERSQAP